MKLSYLPISIIILKFTVVIRIWTVRRNKNIFVCLDWAAFFITARKYANISSVLITELVHRVEWYIAEFCRNVPIEHATIKNLVKKILAGWSVIISNIEEHLEDWARDGSGKFSFGGIFTRIFIQFCGRTWWTSLVVFCACVASGGVEWNPAASHHPYRWNSIFQRWR